MSDLEFTKNQKLALIALIGLSVIGLSLSLGRSMMAARDDVVIREPVRGDRTRVVTSDSDPMPSYRDSGGKVVFHIVGCVKAPGVYSLPKGDRICDAVKAAGGSKADADLEALNLAEKIVDGSKISVPSMSERVMRASMGSTLAQTALARSPKAGLSIKTTSASSSGKLQIPGEGTVNINSAGAEDLQRLPGVGPSTAQKILEYRNQVGRFSSADGLMDVKGIGPKKLEKMRPFVAL